GWSTVVIPLIPSYPAVTNPARNPSTGNYFYQLRATLTNPTASAYNAFKVRVQAVFASPSSSLATITLNQQSFAFICPNTWPASLNPDGKFSAYDGVWNFYLDVPAKLDSLAVWDGDLDFGSMNADGTNDMAAMDTDDPDTNNAAPYNPATGAG